MENKETSRVLRKLTVDIHGLGCGGGGLFQLERQIKKLKGVAKVYVNPATLEAYVDVSDNFNVDEMLNLIEKNGFSMKNLDGTEWSYEYDKVE